MRCFINIVHQIFRKNITWVVLFTVPSVLFIFCEYLFSEEYSVKEVLDRSEHHYRMISTLQFSADTVSQTSQGNTLDPSYGNKSTVVVKLDQVQKSAYFRTDVTSTSRMTDDGFKEFPDTGRLEFLFHENRGIRFLADTASNEVTAFWSMENGVHGNAEDEGWISIFYETYDLTPIGFFKIGHESIDIFKFIKDMPQQAIRKKKVDGESCYEILAESKKFRIVLCVFPDSDFMFKYFVVERLVAIGGDSSIRKLEYQSSGSSDGGYHLLPENFSVTIESGKLIDVQMFREGKLVSEKLPQYRDRMDAKIIQSSVNVQLSANDFHFETKISNGTKVRVEEVPQIPYIWFNGKIEPKTDELMLKIARGNHKFIPGVEEPRFWIMALGVIFIIVGFSLKAKTLIQQWREK